jgi:hypothetical protein
MFGLSHLQVLQPLFTAEAYVLANPNWVRGTYPGDPTSSVVVLGKLLQVAQALVPEAAAIIKSLDFDVNGIKQLQVRTLDPPCTPRPPCLCSQIRHAHFNPTHSALLCTEGGAPVALPHTQPCTACLLYVMTPPARPYGTTRVAHAGIVGVLR